MILELASLTVLPGRQPAFELAFEKAQRLLASAQGYLSHELRRSIERDQHYALLIEWRALDDRTLGFGHSLADDRWQALLGQHLAEQPRSEYFSGVALPTRGGAVPSD